jgi:Tfp pilus assembly protein PilN
MSVRVNLLPEATRQRGRASQQRAIAGVAGAVLLAGLGGVYWTAANAVSKAEDELAEAEAFSATLRAEVSELQAFEDLAARSERSEQAIADALSGEVSMAGVLQDLAAVMPPDSQLDTLALQLNRPGDPEQPLGTLNLNGRSVISHAGVEQVLLQLDKITTFGGLHLNSSTEEEIEELDDPISTFIVEGELGERAATGRYVDGLPEERS